MLQVYVAPKSMEGLQCVLQVYSGLSKTVLKDFYQCLVLYFESLNYVNMLVLNKG